MIFRETLPADCPPEAAEEIAEQRDVYRLVASDPPTETDFQSQRALRPAATFSVPECQAHGLSVHTDRADSRRAAKLPRLRGKRICRVRLLPGAGHLQQTGTPSHHTWWPSAEFDILAQCEVEMS